MAQIWRRRRRGGVPWGRICILAPRDIADSRGSTFGSGPRGSAVARRSTFGTKLVHLGGFGRFGGRYRQNFTKLGQFWHGIKRLRVTRCAWPEQPKVAESPRRLSPGTRVWLAGVAWSGRGTWPLNDNGDAFGWDAAPVAGRLLNDSSPGPLPPAMREWNAKRGKSTSQIQRPGPLPTSCYTTDAPTSPAHPLQQCIFSGARSAARGPAGWLRRLLGVAAQVEGRAPLALNLDPSCGPCLTR